MLERSCRRRVPEMLFGLFSGKTFTLFDDDDDDDESHKHRISLKLRGPPLMCRFRAVNVPAI